MEFVFFARNRANGTCSKSAVDRQAEKEKITQMNIGQQCNYVQVDWSKFKPCADYILVKPIERVASSIIAVVLDEKPNLGTVVAVGPGKRDKKDRIVPLDVRAGDTIRFGEFAFPFIIIGTEKHLLMREADVAGVVEPDAIAA